MSNSTTKAQSQTHQGDNMRENVREMVNETGEAIRSGAQECTTHFVTEPAQDLFSLAKAYAKDKPEVACAWAFGLGVIVGWKIKPW